MLKQEDPRVAVLDRIDNPDFAAKAKAAVQEGRCFVADYTGEDPAYPAPSFVQVRLILVALCLEWLWGVSHCPGVLL